MKYLLDTDVCIHVLRGQPEVIEKIRSLNPQDIRVSVVTRFELMYGVERCAPRRREVERQKVERFLQLITVVPLEERIADRAAVIRRRLSDLGTPIGPYDLLIAASAWEGCYTLVSNNQKEFGRIEELRLESWV